MKGFQRIKRVRLLALLAMVNAALLGGTLQPDTALAQTEPGTGEDYRGLCSSCKDDNGLWYSCCPGCDGDGCNCTSDGDC